MLVFKEFHYSFISKQWEIPQKFNRRVLPKEVIVPTYDEVLCRHLEMLLVIINNSENFHQSTLR